MLIFSLTYDMLLDKIRETYVGKTIQFTDQNFFMRTIKCTDIAIVMADDNDSWLNITDDAGNKYVCTGGNFNVLLADIKIIG